MPPPCYAVILTSRLVLRRAGDERRYARMSRRMADLAARQPGCLGLESARGPDGFGVTVSYCRDLASIAAWGADPRRRVAQVAGRARFHGDYAVRVARVERSHGPG